MKLQISIPSPGLVCDAPVQYIKPKFSVSDITHSMCAWWLTLVQYFVSLSAFDMCENQWHSHCQSLLIQSMASCLISALSDHLHSTGHSCCWSLTHCSYSLCPISALIDYLRSLSSRCGSKAGWPESWCLPLAECQHRTAQSFPPAELT